MKKEYQPNMSNFANKGFRDYFETNSIAWRFCGFIELIEKEEITTLVYSTDDSKIASYRSFDGVALVPSRHIDMGISLEEYRKEEAIMLSAELLFLEMGEGVNIESVEYSATTNVVTFILGE